MSEPLYMTKVELLEVADLLKYLKDHLSKLEVFIEVIDSNSRTLGYVRNEDGAYNFYFTPRKES